MKNIIFVFILLAGFAVSASAQFLTKTSEPQTYALTADDTMNIYKADGIVGLAIIVPAGATDSVWVDGGTGTLDGHNSGFIKLAPNTIVNLGYDDMIRLDSVTIVVKDKASIFAIPYKR